MSAPTRSARRRRVAREVAVFVIVLGASSGALVTVAGASFSDASAAQIGSSLITANGLLLAFTGIIFTAMLAEVRFQSDRAVQTSDELRIRDLESTSGVLRVTAFGSFVAFGASLVASIIILAEVLESGATGPVTAWVGFLPSAVPLAVGLAFLITALSELAFGAGLSSVARGSPPPAA